MLTVTFFIASVITVNILAKVCNKEDCIKFADTVLANMNDSVNPCDDFFEYACGNFERNHPMRGDRTMTRAFDVLMDRVMKDVIGLLKRPIKQSENFSIRMAKTFFASCMAKETQKKFGTQPLLDKIEKYGYCPVFQSNWSEVGYSWEAQSSLLQRKSGVHPLIKVSVDVDPTNSELNLINLNRPEFGIDRELLALGLKNEKVKAYYSYMTGSIQALLGFKRGKARRVMKPVVQLEIALAQNCLSATDARNISLIVNRMTFEQLLERFPSVNLKKIASELFDNSPVEIAKGTVFNVEQVEYLELLTETLSRFSNGNIANYIIWKYVMGNIRYLPNKYNWPRKDFVKVLRGETKKPPKAESCYTMTGSVFSRAISQMFVSKYFTPETNEKMVEIIKYVKEGMKEGLESNSWMDEITRSKALLKLEKMKPIIGHDEDYLDLEVDTEGWDESMITKKQLFTNYQLMKEWQFSNYWKTLENPRRNTLIKPAYEVNAWYNWNSNEILLPAAILQPATFWSNAAALVNFHAIGFIIGHEITHGYDDMGSEFDEKGNYKNWWTAETRKLFNEKKQCFINQYGNIYIPRVNLTLKAEKSAGENIADNGGIRLAFRGYELWEEAHPNERVNGIAKLENFTKEKIQLLSYANVWCGKYKLEGLEQQIVGGVHTPMKFRVNVPLQNFDKFSEAFNCEKGTPMNPENKCQLW